MAGEITQPEFMEPQERDELRIEELGLGSIVTMTTVTGSVYKLEVTEVDSFAPRGVLSRQSDHGVGGETESWERVDNDTLFELSGSCSEVLHDTQGNVYFTDPELAVLKLGRRARLRTIIDGADKTLVTSEIKSLKAHI